MNDATRDKPTLEEDVRTGDQWNTKRIRSLVLQLMSRKACVLLKV